MIGQRNQPERYKEIGIRLAIVVVACVWLAIVAVTWAEGSETNEEAAVDRSPASDDAAPAEYSFRWLDPEKKIYVLQNRRFLKAHHILVSGMGGLGLGSPYRQTYVADPRIAYFFTEDLGLEVFYTFGFNYDNNVYQALVAASPVLPLIREIRGQYGVKATWVPWYAKINVFNNILHFDWYFSGGVGNLQTFLDINTVQNAPHNFQEQDVLAGLAGTGLLFHLTDLFKVRLDFSGAIYSAPVFGNTGGNAWYGNYTVTTGVAFSP